MNILILGCGQIGQALATQLSHEHHVTALSRSAKDHFGFQHIQQDIHHIHLPEKDCYDWVYVILAPDQRSIEDYRNIFMNTAESVFQALKNHPIQRVVFISSTRVYGENKGHWINDQTLPNTDDLYGQCLIEAEKKWLSYWQEKLVIIRPSGLYQENSVYLRRLAHQASAIDKLHWTNRIHRKDLIGFLKYMIQLNQFHPSYLLSNLQPMLQHEIINFIREKDGLEPLSLEENLEYSGKRIKPNHLIESGYQLHYPYFVKSTLT